MLTLPCHAKLNLYLRVVGRRPDGFHELETVMQELALADEIRFEADETLSLSVDVPGLPVDESNLVIRAARLLAGEAGVPAAARIALSKRIPLGGGLGGGSSNAAATLRGLDRLWDLHTPPEDLHRLAAGLGSDVAFFLHGGAALCRGRGEIVTPVPAASGLPYVLLLPSFGCPTAEVYERLSFDLTTRPPDVQHVLSALEQGDVEALASLVYNDLTEPARQVRPELGMLAESAGRIAGAPVHLSGSGSTLFLVGDHPQLCETLQQRPEALPCPVRCLATRGRDAPDR
jgi:4-diphosphocytidyl-2-C-methyl-D-erythritol kinase